MGLDMKSRIAPTCCRRCWISCNAACSCLRAAAIPASWPSAKPLSQASRSMPCRSAPRRLRASTGPLICGSSQTAVAWTSDILLAALAAQLQAAFLAHAPRGDQNLLLRRLDLRQPHRTARFQVVLHHLRRAFRHVLEYFLLEFVAGHFAQQLLHAAIVDLVQVLEHEHQILQLQAQRLIDLGNLSHDHAFLRAADQVQYAGGRLRTAEAAGSLAATVAGKLFFEHLVELIKRCL